MRQWVLCFFGILIPPSIDRTDVGKLINKSLGDVEIHFCIQRLQERRELCRHTTITSVCAHKCSFSPCSTDHLLLIPPCFCSDTGFAVQVKPKWETQGEEEAGWLVFHFLLTHCVITSHQLFLFYVQTATGASYYSFDTSDKSKYWIFQQFCIRRVCNNYESVFSAVLIIRFNWNIVAD